MDITELIKLRKEYIDAQRKNGFDLTPVLVGLYSNISHFIYEILQNAEDACASEIIFNLKDNKLKIKHNGIPFSPSDIETITSISNLNNEKRNDRQKIGKFGIGFKSVYAVTETPRIQSGIYEFEIQDLVLPINFSDTNNYPVTTITLPFSKTKLSPEKIHEIIVRKFQTFETYNLLFLSNLKSIIFKWDGKTKHYTTEESSMANCSFGQNILVSDGEKISQYLVFKTPVRMKEFSSLKNKQYVALAFKYEEEDGQLTIVKPNSSNLFAYFETSYETFLKFLIQAPFTTTPARDNVDFDLEENEILLDEICDLLVDTIEYFKKEKLISINFLQHLPIDSDIDETKYVYFNLYERIKAELKSDKKLLPTKVNGTYQSAKNLAIVRGKELSSLIYKKEDMKEIFGRSFWMDTSITQDRTPKLLSYLKNELEIKEFDSEDFAKRISEKFLQSKSDKWIRKFYEFLNKNQESLWREGYRNKGILRTKPIIRLADNSHSVPFNSQDEPIVFLPVKRGGSDFATIKSEVIKSKASLKFIQKLGIKEPGLLDILKQNILPKYKREKPQVSVREHHEHMKLALDIFQSANDNRKNEISELFEDTEIRFFRAKDAKTGEISFQNYQYTYIPTDSLRKFLLYTNNIYFFYIDGYKSFDHKLLLQFLKQCDVHDYPWIISYEPNFSQEKLLKLRKAGNYGEGRKTDWRGEEIVDYKLEGLEDFMKHNELTKADSILIWDIIIHILQQKNKEDLFSGYYSWYYYSPHRKTFKSSLLKLLQEKAWLFSQGEETKYRPQEINILALDENYEKDTEEAVKLIEKLKFLSTAEDNFLNQLPDDKRSLYNQFEEAMKLCDEQGVDFEIALKKIKDEVAAEKEKQEMDETPVIESVNVTETVFEGFDTNTSEPKEQAAPKPESESGNGKQKKRGQQSQKMRNFIGNRGEQIVFKFLKTKWSKSHELLNEENHSLKFKNHKGEIITIDWINSETKKGVGCDILIKIGVDVIEYIEVKSTNDDGKNLYPVNGFQWSSAYKLYNEGRGNNYYFYIVRSALSEKPTVTTIKNPIKLWKDGKLRAHPVNLEL